jgi:hypothetical protein
MTENIVTGKAYRVMMDLQNGIWNKISFWKKASDVYDNNNKPLQTTIGAIAGITDSLTSTSSNVVASAKAIKELNDKITELITEFS